MCIVTSRTVKRVLDSFLFWKEQVDFVCALLFVFVFSLGFFCLVFVSQYEAVTGVLPMCTLSVPFKIDLILRLKSVMSGFQMAPVSRKF